MIWFIIGGLVALLIIFLVFNGIISKSRASVFVMAPLDVIDDNCNLKNPDEVHYWLNKLHEAHADGVMVDVWWGIVEKEPHVYNWSGYMEFFLTCSMYGIKVLPVLSFHKCGGNVGDSITIELPEFARKSDVHFFKDQFGNIDNEYIAFSYDETKIDEERTPLDMYRDFMNSFKDKFAFLIEKNVITGIEVGLGPCGEIRFPSYQLDKWEYPGGGALQCYDELSLANLREAANNDDFADPPIVGKDYNSSPNDSEFWSIEGAGFKSEKSKFFFNWYNKQLVNHADRVLSIARDIFPKVRLSSKVAGIHWWHTHESHCAEATAGLYTYGGSDGYKNIAEVLAKYNCALCFTCLEMLPDEGSRSDPVALVNEVIRIAKSAGIQVDGENALECYDRTSFKRIIKSVNKGIKEFTFLRMTDELMKPEPYSNFSQFVLAMHFPYLRL